MARGRASGFEIDLCVLPTRRQDADRRVWRVYFEDPAGRGSGGHRERISGFRVRRGCPGDPRSIQETEEADALTRSVLAFPPMGERGVAPGGGLFGQQTTESRRLRESSEG